MPGATNSVLATNARRQDLPACRCSVHFRLAGVIPRSPHRPKRGFFSTSFGTRTQPIAAAEEPARRTEQKNCDASGTVGL